MANIQHIFGTLKTKITAQEFKDLAREGWETDEEEKVTQIPNAS